LCGVFWKQKEECVKSVICMFCVCMKRKCCVTHFCIDILSTFNTFRSVGLVLRNVTGNVPYSSIDSVVIGCVTCGTLLTTACYCTLHFNWRTHYWVRSMTVSVAGGRHSLWKFTRCLHWALLCAVVGCLFIHTDDTPNLMWRKSSLEYWRRDVKPHRKLIPAVYMQWAEGRFSVWLCLFCSCMSMAITTAFVENIFVVRIWLVLFTLHMPGILCIIVCVFILLPSLLYLPITTLSLAWGRSPFGMGRGGNLMKRK
jgi:hypothetical protein